MFAQTRSPILTRGAVAGTAGSIDGAGKLQQFIEFGMREEDQRTDAGAAKNLG